MARIRRRVRAPGLGWQLQRLFRDALLVVCIVVAFELIVLKCHMGGLSGCREALAACEFTRLVESGRVDDARPRLLDCAVVIEDRERYPWEGAG